MATVSPELLRPRVSKSSKESKYVIISAGIFLAILFMSIFVAWSTGPSSPTKRDLCIPKVTGLAHFGYIRSAAAYYTAINACVQTNTDSSIYGSVK
jgi:hypothetical protein